MAVQFIKVRSRRGPKHTYWVSVDQARVHPEKYVVVDDTPRDKPGRVEYVDPKPAASSRESVGDAKKEEA